MKLIRCEIENFGKLQQASFAFTDGCNVRCAENGWGKSTLAVFIRVMLYGFENEGKRDAYANERRRYKPWQGGVYGGSLTFETEGTAYVVSRTFGAKAKEDTFALRDAATNLPSMRFSERLGEELLQIDSASFARTAFISQNDCETAATDSIHAKIGDLTEQTDDMNRYDEVDARLHDLLNAMSPRRKTGSLAKKKEEISMLAEAVRQQETVDAALRALAEKKQAEEEAYAQLRKRREQLQREQQRIQVYQDAKEKLTACRALQAYAEMQRKCEALRLSCEEKTSRADSIQEEVQRHKKHTRSVYAALLLAAAAGVLLAVAGMLLTKGVLCVVGIVCMAAGVLFCAVVYALNIRRGYAGDVEALYRQIAENEEARKQIEAAKKELYTEAEYKAAVRSYAQYAEKETLSRLQETVQAFEAQQPPAQGALTARELARVTDACDAAQKNLLLYARQSDELAARADQICEQSERLTICREQYEKETKAYQRLQKTQELLRQAKTNLTARYMAPVKNGFEKYYRLLTGEGADSYLLDADINLTLAAYGTQHEVRFLSTGYRDLVGLCLRMALIDAMFQGEKPFLVFDDPFANLDEEKREKGMAFLQEAAKNYQILYFTCR